MENNEFVIKLDVAGRIYPVIMKRGEEQEESLIRKAAKRVQQDVTQYKQHFAKSEEDRDILAMIAIQLAVDVISLEETNDTEPFTHKIRQLTKLLDNYLTDN